MYDRRACATSALLRMTLVVCLLAPGCSNPSVATYRLPGHDPDAVQTVAVLPFLDARSLRDPRDPLDDEAAEVTRRIFLEELQATPALARRTLIAPRLAAPTISRSVSEAVDFGQQLQADLVVAGQVFSFVDTRGASIPPRAGLFVRFISVPEERTVFAGEDYRAGGSKPGGRQERAREVCRAILDQYGQGPALPAADTEQAPRLLVLPYHERENTANLIPHTGGGAVVTSLLQMELARSGRVRIVEPDGKTATHGALLSVAEALAAGRAAGADYVLRGQVVEFRRAMSVPNLLSAVISTAIVAAQMIFAEMSGVDFATEIYRVEDGACVFAQRDASRQKYVVRTEVTIRRLCQRTVPRILHSLAPSAAAAATPLIDTLEVRELPAPPTPEEPAPAATEEM